jgi:hypothetical protein
MGIGPLQSYYVHMPAHRKVDICTVIGIQIHDPNICHPEFYVLL